MFSVKRPFRQVYYIRPIYVLDQKYYLHLHKILKIKSALMSCYENDYKLFLVLQHVSGALWCYEPETMHLIYMKEQRSIN